MAANYDPKSPTSSHGSSRHEEVLMKGEKGVWVSNDDSDSKLQTHHTDLKLDPYGIPLKPQPSRFADDPLVRSHISYRPDGPACNQRPQ